MKFCVQQYGTRYNNDLDVVVDSEGNLLECSPADVEKKWFTRAYEASGDSRHNSGDVTESSLKYFLNGQEVFVQGALYTEIHISVDAKKAHEKWAEIQSRLSISNFDSLKKEVVKTSMNEFGTCEMLNWTFNFESDSKALLIAVNFNEVDLNDVQSAIFYGNFNDGVQGVSSYTLTDDAKKRKEDEARKKNAEMHARIEAREKAEWDNGVAQIYPSIKFEQDYLTINGNPAIYFKKGVTRVIVDGKSLAYKLIGKNGDNIKQNCARLGRPITIIHN
jgi:hypothetical protein